MGDKSAIEWTEATWNPVTGCSKVSPGCAHCYAEALSLRFGRSAGPWTPENAAKNVILHPDRLEQPLRWRRPRMIFVNSMSDLFHELIPDDFIAAVFGVMAACPEHTFQILTKRPERAREWFEVRSAPTVLEEINERACEQIPACYLVPMDATWPLPNVWLGVSIENSRYTHRADALREIPAAVRFISAEPLLGSLFADGRNRAPLDLAGIHWLIAGGESGPHYRPVQLEWIRELRRAAAEAGVAFFFKQWGGRTPKSGGRELDGRTYSEMPAAAVSS